MYTKSCKLGKGSYGQVYLANHEVYGLVAVKEVEYHKHKTAIMREVAILRHLTNSECCGQYIIKLYEYIDLIQEGQLLLFLEYVQGNPVHITNLTDWLRLANFLITSLKCLHQCGVVHRDIKVANVLRTEDGHFKIVDFGLSCFTQESEYRCDDSVVGTTGYFSPEVIMGPNEGDDINEILKASDFWAAGILLYHLWYKVSPYPAVSRDTTMDLIVDMTEFELDPAPEEVLTILRILLTIDYKERMKKIASLT